MAHIDIFKSNAFGLVSMLEAIESTDHQPTRLGDMGIFTPKPVRTSSVSIESRDNVLSLVPTTPRGAPIDQRKNDKRKMRNFNTVRIAKGDTLMASEIADIRAFGSETELMQVQAEVMRRMMGPGGIVNDINMTLENMRLGAVQGIVKDADGSTLFNWFDEFGITVLPGAEVDFDLDNATPASGAVRTLCSQIVRAMMRNAKGAWSPTTQVHALCGDAFWDGLTAHREVRETYLNTQEARDLRGGSAYESFNYGGITWENYRGTDDGTTVAIPTDKVKFFPVGAPGAFLEVWSPGEAFEHIGQLGQPYYPMIVPDKDRNTFVDIEVYSYPLHVCTRPLMLQSGRRT